MDNGTPPPVENKAEVTKATPNTTAKDTRPVYAVTITFKKLICKSPFGQFKETAPYITKLLKRSCDFQLYPEWRHQTGDIHYHGVIKINDMVKWFKQTLPSLKCQGFTCIKKIDNMEKWETYYKKEVDIAKGILPEHLQLPLDREVVVYKTKTKKRIMLMPTIETVEKEVSDSE